MRYPVRLPVILIAFLIAACSQKETGAPTGADTPQSVPANGSRITGLWDGEIVFKEATVEFPMEFAGPDDAIVATLFNGDERITSTSGSLKGDTLTVDFDQNKDRMEVTLKDGVLSGTLFSQVEGRYSFPLTLKPHRPAPVASNPAPDIK